MKKTLALVLALAMVFSTITVAFAEDAIGADAQICTDLKVLVGEGNGVDAAYLTKAPTRIQAAVMFLRLKGLEAEAKAFTGEANFADADKAAWAKPIMAYLKANPQLGWQGDGTNFDPTGLTTAQAYYKVMLEALGYKQTTPEVVGDFAYADVITFAAGKGLTKVAAVTNFTVNDLAIATVEALKANMKEGGKTLAATLVEAGKIDKAAAIKAELYADAAATTAKLDTVTALGNNKVLVEFDAAVDKAFAENVANYKLVVKGGDVVEVKAAVLDESATTLVVLETAPLTAGNAYTMTVGEVSKNFAGIAKVSSAPEIDEVEGPDSELVDITFTTSMDMATALDVANYAISGITVESVAWCDADGERDAVELTTKGLVANKTYKVVVTNVKSVDGVVMKSDSMNFVSKADKKAPKLDTTRAQTYVDTNTRIIVTFTDDNEITKESAENIANYKLEVGSTENTLEIQAAKLVEDNDSDMKRVELTTVPQKKNQKYVLSVNNIVDTSVLANKMTKEETVNLYGEEADEDAPELVGMTYVSKTLVDVEFDDDSRIDSASVLDINNYEFDHDVVVEKAELVDEDDPKNDKVRLTVSPLGDSSRYEITVSNIADEYGNVMEDPEDDQATFKSELVNRVAAIEKAIATSDTEIELHFQYKDLDEDTAEDVANYSIDGDIGTPSDASYDSGDNVVTLTTEAMNPNEEYEITVNGVKDIAENVLVDLTADVVVASSENDVDAPEIDEVECDASTIVVVTFSEPIDVDTDPTNLQIGIDTDDDDVADVTGTYAVSSDEDDTVLEFTVPAFTDDKDVVLVSTNARDLAGNLAEIDTDNSEFSATDEAADDIELDTWDQTDVYTFELQYSEKVKLIDENVDEVSDAGYDFTIEVDSDDQTLVTLTSDKRLDVDDEIYLVLGTKLEGFHGQAVLDLDDDEAGNEESATYLEVGLDDEDAPYIDEAEATDRQSIDITFNENLGYKGDWIVAYEDEDGDREALDIDSITLDDDVVTITLGDDTLESDEVYTLIVTDLPKDLAGNEMDAVEEDDEDGDGVYEFIGTDVVGIGDYITGVKIYNGTKFTAFTNVNVEVVTTQSVYDSAATSFATTDADTDEFVFVSATTSIDGHDIPTAVLAADTDYTVKINGFSYEFEGVVENDIDVDYDDDTLAFEFDYDDITEDDIVAVISEGGSKTTVVDSDENAEIAAADISGDATIVVMRGNVVLFYIEGYDLDALH